MGHRIEKDTHEEDLLMTIETVLMNDYEIVRQRPSVLGIGQDIETREGFTCPQCQCPNPELEHGNASQCPNCKMHFRLYGNALDCSDKFIKSLFAERDVQALRSWSKREQSGVLQRIRKWFAED